MTYRRPGYVGAIARMIAGVAIVSYKRPWLCSLNLIALFNDRKSWQLIGKSVAGSYRRIRAAVTGRIHAGPAAGSESNREIIKPMHLTTAFASVPRRRRKSCRG